MFGDTTSHPSGRGFRTLALLGTLALASGTFGNLEAGPRVATVAPGLLQPGDIVYADSGDAIVGGFIIKVDPVTRSQEVVTYGNLLHQPFDVVVDNNHSIIVSDTWGYLVQINPETREQSVLVDNSDGLLGMPCGLALEPSGTVLVANTEALLRVDPATSLIETVSAGGYFHVPIGVAVADGGEIFVLSTGPAKRIIRVHPQNGVQKLIAQAGYFNNPQALTVVGRYAYVTDIAPPTEGFGIGRIIRVDTSSGTQTILARAGCLAGPVGIEADANGDLIIGDPSTVDPATQLDSGCIIRLNTTTRQQTPLARGTGSYLNPRGIALVPLLQLAGSGTK